MFSIIVIMNSSVNAGIYKNINNISMAKDIITVNKNKEYCSVD